MTNLLIRLFVKNSGETSDPAVRTAYGNLSGFTGIICNLLLFIIKLLAGLLSGSISITADAFNNLSDMGSSVVTLLGFKIAAKPADKEHPFGHGRMEYMSGFLVAVVIIIVGFELLHSAVDKIIQPAAIVASALTVSILIVSILIKLWMYLFFRKIGNTIRSSAVRTTARDSLNDVIATSTVLITSLLALVFDINIDGYVGSAVAVFIMYGGYSAAKEMLSPLLGEAPDPQLVTDIRDGVMAYDGFVGMHDLVIHNYGPGRMYASLHVEVRADCDVVEMHEIIDHCEHEVGTRLGVELVLHMDPIVTDDQHLNEVKAQVAELVKGINSQLSIHDFRMVSGVNRTNLIFDVAVPYGIGRTDNQLRGDIQQAVWTLDKHYFCVINFDNVFVG